MNGALLQRQIRLQNIFSLVVVDLIIVEVESQAVLSFLKLN